MKTLRLFGLTLMAILLSVNFTSCSKDDDPVENPNALVGEWILIHEKYWGTEESGSYNEESSYDFNKPKDGSEKYIIKESTTKGEFLLERYYYSDSEEGWTDNGKITIKLEDKNVKVLNNEYFYEEYTSLTYELKDNKLVLLFKCKPEKGYEQYEDYEELTFQKK